MQTLKEKLKEDLKVAIKSGNGFKKEFIKVVLSEIGAEEKRRTDNLLNDEGVLAIIKKMKKNAETIKDECEKIGKEVPSSSLLEVEILNSYLPKQLTEDQIKMQVSQIIEDVEASSMKDMGKVMKEFNLQFAGQADGKIVSQIVKEKLS